MFLSGLCNREFVKYSFISAFENLVGIKYDLDYTLKNAASDFKEKKEEKRKQKAITEEDAVSLLSAYDIYDLIDKAFDSLNIQNSKNGEVEKSFKVSNGWEIHFKALIRIIYTVLLYQDYNIEKSIDKNDVQLWLDMMKNPEVGMDVAAFDQENVGSVSLYGLIKEINDILYMSYPGYEDMYLEAEKDVAEMNEKDPSVKRIMLVPLPQAVQKDGSVKTPLMENVIDPKNLSKIKKEIIELVYKKMGERKEEESKK